jgi:hypothetical protein
MAIMTVIRSVQNLNHNTDPSDCLVRCDWTVCDTVTNEILSGGVDVLINAGDNATQCETKFRDGVMQHVFEQTGKVCEINNIFQNSMRRG